MGPLEDSPPLYTPKSEAALPVDFINNLRDNLEIQLKANSAAVSQLQNLNKLPENNESLVNAKVFLDKLPKELQPALDSACLNFYIENSDSLKNLISADPLSSPENTKIHEKIGLHEELANLNFPNPAKESASPNSPLTKTNVISFIPFDQLSHIAEPIKDFMKWGREMPDHYGKFEEQYKELHSFDLRFNGYCELICNQILIQNLLEKGEERDFLSKNITTLTLNEDYIKKSHLVDVYNPFFRIIASITKIYPDNLFSTSEQWDLVNKKNIPYWGEQIVINKDILKKGFEKIDDGEILKFEAFTNQFLSFTGHSMLIKKINNNEFIFFDPNRGEKRHLSFEDIVEEINSNIQWGTDALFIRGKDYMQRLQNERILEVVVDANIFPKNTTS